MRVRVGTSPTGYVLNGGRKLRPGAQVREIQTMEEIVTEAYNKIEYLTVKSKAPINELKDHKYESDKL